MRAGIRQAQRRGPADTRGGPGDKDVPPADIALEGVIHEQVRIQVALPVVPEPRRVVAQRGHADAAALEGALGIAVVVARGVVEEQEDRLRQAEVVEDGAQHALHRRQVAERVAHGARDEGEHAAVQAHAETRRVAGFGEDVHEFAEGVVVRVREVEAALVQRVLVGDVVHGVGYEVHGDDIEAAALEAHQRHPGGQCPAQLLQQLEDVVNTVDLVDLAAARVAHDHARTVDAPGNVAVEADDPLGLVFGGEVGVLDLLGLLEHVLAEGAPVETAGGDGTHVLEAAGLQGAGQLHGVARALDVRGHLRGGIGGQVVDRRQVEEVVDASAELSDETAVQAEHGLAEVADDRHQPVGLIPRGLTQRIEAGVRARAGENEQGAFAAQKPPDEMGADEAGAASDEVRHELFLICRRGTSPAV